MKKFEYVGQSIPRTDAVLQVTGRCEYGEDLFRHNMLYAKAHYSRYPHAKILRIDTSKAEGMPGVAAVITHRDVPNNRFGFAIKDQRVLADDKVRYRGDCIAVVAAETLQQAQAAADAIEVEYEPLEPVFDPLDAIREDAPLIHEDQFKNNIPYHIKAYLGNVEEGLAKADLVVEQTYQTQKVDHVPIEPHVALAELGPSGDLIIWTSTSRVFHYIEILVHVLDMPMSRLQVKTPPGIGGSFGGKNEVMLEPWVGLLAMKTGRPVKMVFTREEDMNTSTIRHAYRMHYKTGVMKDGAIIAQQVTMYADTGAYLGLGKSQLTKAVVHACGTYNIPNIKTDGYLVFTNMLNASAMRGMGVPQVNYGMESHMDLIAERLGMDRFELREKNMFGERSKLPNGQLINSEPMRHTYDRALELFRTTAAPTAPTGAKKRGVGLSCMVYPMDPSNPSSSTAVFVRVTHDGTAVLYNGQTDLGQGSDTALTQIASETLGIPVEHIRFVTSDTVLTPYDEGVGASRTTYIVGRAVKDACDKAREMLFAAAAKKLGFADPRKFYIENGVIYLDTYPDIYISVKDAAYYSERVHGFPVIGSSTYATLSSEEDKETGHCRHYEKHIFATQIAEVDVDTQTGEIELQRFIAVHDCGRAVNPLLAKGQIEGGISQGIGYALMEEMIECRKDGRLLTNTFAEYHMPTAVDMPKQLITDLIEIPDKDGAYGAKGISEPTAVPAAAAINNAVSDALGIRITELPLTPERVLIAIRRSQGKGETDF